MIVTFRYRDVFSKGLRQALCSSQIWVRTSNGSAMRVLTIRHIHGHTDRQMELIFLPMTGDAGEKNIKILDVNVFRALFRMSHQHDRSTTHFPLSFYYV